VVGFKAVTRKLESSASERSLFGGAVAASGKKTALPVTSRRANETGLRKVKKAASRGEDHRGEPGLSAAKAGGCTTSRFRRKSSMSEGDRLKRDLRADKSSSHAVGAGGSGKAVSTSHHRSTAAGARKSGYVSAIEDVDRAVEEAEAAAASEGKKGKKKKGKKKKPSMVASIRPSNLEVLIDPYLTPI